jgi:hypothetical protein
MTIRGPVGNEIGCGTAQVRTGRQSRDGPSDCQTRHARRGATGPLGGVALLPGELSPSIGCSTRRRVAPFPLRASRGYSRPSAAVTPRRQRVAVWPSALPRGDPLGHGHTPLPSVCCPLKRCCGSIVHAARADRSQSWFETARPQNALSPLVCSSRSRCDRAGRCQAPGLATRLGHSLQAKRCLAPPLARVEAARFSALG